MSLVRTTFLWFALAVAPPAAAFDLTGSWLGQYSCSEFDGGEKSKYAPGQFVMQITSFGDGRLRVYADGHFSGIEIPDASDPDRGEIALISCGSDNNLSSGSFTELGRFRVSTSGSRGSLSGTSVWSASASHIATCRYSFKRVDTTNPNLSYGCP